MMSSCASRDRLSQDPQYVLQTVQAAMLDFYAVLTTMPHVQPDAIRKPPDGGWANLNMEVLKSRGKADAAINLLRHLPCLVHDAQDYEEQHPSITPDTRSIYFCFGETTRDWEEELIETPSHVVWLTRAITRDGYYLLLDTLNATITHFAPIASKLGLPYEEFEALPSSEKWMAHETLPVQAWFLRERHRIELLLYLPIPPLPGDAEVAYLSRAHTAAEEEELFADDPDDDNYVENGSEEDTDLEEGAGDNDTEYEDDVVSVEEVETLREDAGLSRTTEYAPGANAEPNPVMADEVVQYFPETTPQHVADRPIQVSSLMSPIQNQKVVVRVLHEAGKFKPMKTTGGTAKLTSSNQKQVYEIYTRNGWHSSGYDRKRCRDELIEWAKEERTASRSAEQAKSAARWQKTLADHERRKSLIGHRAEAPQDE